MSNRVETQRSDLPKMQAPQRPREAEFGAAPKAATNPMRTRRDDQSADTKSSGSPASQEPADGGPDSGAAKRSDQPAATDRNVKTAKGAKPGKRQKGAKTSKKQPMIQRVTPPPDFPEFPDLPADDAEKPEGREDSPQMVRAIAVGMPILGLIGGGAFTFGLAALGQAGQFPFSFAVGLIAVLCMMAGVTVIALNLLRQSQRVGKQTDELLSQYFEPETAATKTVATLGDAIRREMEKLSGNLDALTERIATIEKRLQEQSSELGHAMDRLEQRAKATGQTLSDERDRIEDTARTLNDRTQNAAHSLDEQIAAARSVMDRASGHLSEADKTLKERIGALDTTAQSTASGATEASEILKKEAERVSEISQTALDAAKRTTDRYQNQHRMLTEAIDKLTEEAGRMDRVFDTQRQSLRDIADAAAKQSERIEEVLANCVKGLEGTLESATAKAESIGATFTEQSESILSAGEDAADSMMRAAQSAQTSAEEARRVIEDHAGASQRTLNDQLADARAALSGLTDETVQALGRQLEASQGTMDSLLAGLRDLVDSRLQQARGLFDSMISEFDRTIEEQISALREHRDDDRRDWDAWRDRIGTALEGVRLQARDSLRTLNETAGEVEERLSGLPAKLTGSTEQVQRSMTEQVRALETLSASARESVGAVEALLEALPEKVSASSGDLTATLQGHAEAIEDLTQGARTNVGDLERMLDRLPRRVDGHAAQIRALLDGQMQKIDELAALAARRAQDISELRRSAATGAPRADAAKNPDTSQPRTQPRPEGRRSFGSGTAQSPAPETQRADAPKANGGANRGASEEADYSELSVQEILARKEGPPEAAPADASGEDEDGEADSDRMPPPSFLRSERGSVEGPVPEQRHAEHPQTKRTGQTSPGSQPSQPAPPERERPPAGTGADSGETRQHVPAARAAADQRSLDHPTDFRRMAGRAEPPEPTGGGGRSPAPSFLRRPAKPEAKISSGAKPAQQRPAETGHPKPIFNKRFTDFEEQPGARVNEGPESSFRRAPDDPVSIRKGESNVQSRHPAAARRAMMRDAKPSERTPDDAGRQAAPPARSGPERGGTAETPERRRQTPAPDAAKPQAKQEEVASAEEPEDFGPPPMPNSLRQAMTRQEDRNKPDEKSSSSDSRSEEFGQPPIPNALRSGPARRGDKKRDGKTAEPPEAGEKPAAKPGRLAWSDILAAADRASHEEGIPEAETGLDPETEKARTAVPDGPALGTPELQAIAREIVSVLQTLSLDLRPVWRETLPPEVIRRFLKGDKRALTRRLPVMGGMEAMTRIRRRYRSEPRFRTNVDRFVQEFDVLVDQIHGLDAARAEKYMSSQNGRLFILLKQVLAKS